MTRPLEAMVPHLASGSASPRPADTPGGQRHIFVRDLVLSCNIGVYRHERDAPQRVRLNIDLAIADDAAGATDRLECSTAGSATVALAALKPPTL